MTPELEAAYAEPHRRYHTRAHIEDCLKLLDAVGDLSDRDRRLLTWAIWWHDAVYDPTRLDNEAKSAERAEHDLAGQGADASERAEVVRLILTTAGHTVEPGDRLGAILVSIDLSILGRDPETYDRYAAQIRQEYAFVPEDLYRTGRAAVLNKFLQAVVIYPDAGFAARFEAQARANLTREIDSLI